MPSKTAKKPKLTDAERHKRFVAMAREVEASESPKAFDKAFKTVTSGRNASSPAPSKKRA
jgi:hypothetical protein